MNLYSIAKDRSIYSSKVEIIVPPLSPLYEEDISSEEEEEDVVTTAPLFNHVDYIKSIQKNRPLPQLPPPPPPKTSLSPVAPLENTTDHLNEHTIHEENDTNYHHSTYGDNAHWDNDDFYDDQAAMKKKINQGTQKKLENISLSLIDDVQELIEINRHLASPPSSPTLPPIYKRNTTHGTIFPFDPSTTIFSSSLLENIKPYRRMASKTNDNRIQFTYTTYLISLLTQKDLKDHHELGQEAVYWIDKLAKQNYPEALYTKGNWYLNTPSFTNYKYSLQKALKYLQHAAKLGLTEAYYQLAEVYRKEEDAKMMMNYELAAAKNHTLALYVSDFSLCVIYSILDTNVFPQCLETSEYIIERII
jgi:ureidoglycolate hydrolase